MKTAHQYAEEAVRELIHSGCPTGEVMVNVTLKTIPLEALVKCAAIVLEINARIPRCRSGSCPPIVRLSQPIRARITEALEELEREEGK